MSSDARLSPLVRIGLPLVGGALPAAARAIGAPVLVSANALARYRATSNPGPRSMQTAAGWRDFVGFRLSMPDLDGMDVALDSAGFVAWARYGGFPWSVGDYVSLAGARSWTWWAQMDACCEPEIAAQRGVVRLRQAETIRLLSECRREAKLRGVGPPMPVLQGWTPADYVWHVDQLDLSDTQIVGVGSMCRRHVKGPVGLLAVVDALDQVLPECVRLHLFGVKSQGLTILARHPRIASIDSMAWDYAARVTARCGNGGATMGLRKSEMERWYSAQISEIRAGHATQPGLFGPGAPEGVEMAYQEWGDLLAAGECSFFEALHFASIGDIYNHEPLSE